MAKKDNGNTQISSGKDHITTVAPKAEKKMIEMKEIPYDPIEDIKKAVKDNIKEKIKSLVGHSLEKAQKELDALVAAGDIAVYRILNPGQLATSDYVSNRVQVLVGSDHEVKSISVG